MRAPSLKRHPSALLLLVQLGSLVLYPLLDSSEEGRMLFGSFGVMALLLAVWVVNPYTALLLVPAVHLALIAAVPETRLPRPVAVLGVVAGLVPWLLVALIYAAQLSFGPLELVWAAPLALAVAICAPVGAIPADRYQTVMPAGSVLKVRLDDTIGSDRSRKGERFTATVVADESGYELPEGAEDDVWSLT